MSQRNTFIDELKGIAILLVVLGHIMQYVFKQPPDEGISNLIGSFHMPFFMFLAGVSLAFRHEVIEIRYVLKRIICLIVPFYVWGGTNI